MIAAFQITFCIPFPSAKSRDRRKVLKKEFKISNDKIFIPVVVYPTMSATKRYLHRETVEFLLSFRQIETKAFTVYVCTHS